jgi:hypothetical protein
VQDKKFNEINDLRIGQWAGWQAVQGAMMVGAIFYFCA